MKLKYLRVVFDATLKGYELPMFRAAVAQAAGFEHDAFHNHRTDGSVIHRYPLIQYKTIRGNPALVCVGEGTTEVSAFFQNNQSSHLTIGDKLMEVKMRDLVLHQFTMQVWEHQFRYRLRDWLPLDADAYRQYQTEDDEARWKNLQSKIVGNILGMARGIGWQIDKKIECTLHEVLPMRLAMFKGLKMSCFDIEFSSNVFLPDYIGLGKGVSHGFGVVKSLKN